MRIKITNARVAFAQGLFKASAMEEGQTAKYGADFILTSASKVAEIGSDGKVIAQITMDDAMLKVANETWKGKGKSILEDLEASKKSYRNGNKRKDKNGDVRDGYEGNWYVTAKSATRPDLRDQKALTTTEEDGLIYSGCYVDVIFDLYGNPAKGKQGVFAGLKGVQFRKDGDAFGGGGAPLPDSAFAPIEGSDADDMC